MARSRCSFLGGVGAAAAGAALSRWAEAKQVNSPFRVAVINDEITQDFGRACEITAQEFGLSWIELRGMWDKNLLKLDANQLDEAQRILKRFNLRVTDIASPLFKVDWPGAPKSQYSPKRDEFGASFGSKQQDDVLEHSIELAKRFGTDRVRGFDFWRLDDQAPYRQAIDAKLREAAEKCGKAGVIFILENEFACNTATGAELARTLNAVQSPHLMGNWDPGNAAMRGEVPYPDGYKLLPKDRIGHVHCKDIVPKPSGSGFQWAAMGSGTIRWADQFRALKQDGYHYAVSLETHWRGGGTAEASTRKSMAGMQNLLREAGALTA